MLAHNYPCKVLEMIWDLSKISLERNNKRRMINNKSGFQCNYNISIVMHFFIFMQEAERKAQEERIRTENILSGNPLLNNKPAEFKVKRRWDDDVVFKNCAIEEPDRKEKPFINDTLRSSFHKKFMEKYVK